MVQLSMPLVFTRNSVPGVPWNSFLRGVCALRSCERLLLAILGYRFGSYTSFKLQQVEKRWSNYLCHLFLHAIAFLECHGIPFFAAFARSVRANDCCWQSLVTGSAHVPPLSCNKWRKDGPIIYATCFYTQ